MTEGRPERADAARNRRAILRATEELLTRHPPEQVSVERIAAAAGVGKGTVFHRFGSRMGLMVALMEQRSTALTEAVTAGPPPLGPGAPPRERLLAFLGSVVDVVGRNKWLLAALGPSAATIRRTEPPRAHPVYDLWHGHVAALIAAERPDVDAELIGHLLLGSLRSDPVLDLLERGEHQRLADALHTLTVAVLEMPE